MARIGVIGAGIAGLTAAYRLQEFGFSVRVLEASERVGGVIQSTRQQGFLVEHGPNSVQPTSELEDLIADLKLGDERVWADDAASTRYVVRNGRPVPLPMSLGAFITTDLFSTRAKLRLLAEPFIRTPRSSADEESLAAFTRRRLGPEVLNYAVAPFVGGVYAGDPEQLSARHAFERLVELERQHGSLFWGALRSALGDETTDDVPSGLFSFRDGLETLPRALAGALGDRIVRKVPVAALEPDGTGWAVEVDRADDGPTRLSFDAVVCTVPLHALRQIRVDTPLDLSALYEVPYPPVSVVALGFERSAVAHPLDGFGLLVPPVEDDFDVLGTIFSSSLFRGRAPEGHVLLTTFLGGARAPALAERAPTERTRIVERDLDRLLGLRASPVFARQVQWARAIPQYTVGYGTVKKVLRQLEQEHETLLFAGNYRQGVALGDAAASGIAAAERAEDALRRAP